MNWLEIWRNRSAVVGMNYRNRQLVQAHNTRRLIALAKNKIATKECLLAEGVPVPAHIAEVHFVQELPKVYSTLQQYAGGFVAKPASSSQGRGVLICNAALPDRILLHDGSPLSYNDFKFYISQTLYGEYSFGLPVDAALFEQRIRPHKSWIYQELPGAPDLRIIVDQGKAIMAMARIPTVESEGRANLHCGGVGVGIDLETGRTTYAVQQGQPVLCHPDTKETLEHHLVTDFPLCRRMAERCFKAIPLGYMGVDIMYDVNNGPVVLEVNARPGLAVQIANRAGLRARLNS